MVTVFGGGEAQACYQAALAGDSQLAGEVVVQFTLDAKRHVSKVEVEAPGPPELQRCLAASFQTTLFERSASGNATVTLELSTR